MDLYPSVQPALLKLGLSSGSFRSLTDVYKSQSIGSTGDHKCRSDLAINRCSDQSTDEYKLHIIGSTGVQFQICRVLGELHRRNQPAFKPYASDQPVLKKIAGPPVIYVSCPRTSSSLFRPTPAAADLVLAPPLASAPPPLAAARLHVEPPPPRPRARPAPPVRACAARANALRRRLRA